jgi:hypothetical protein
MTADLLEINNKDFLVSVTEIAVLATKITVAEIPKITVCVWKVYESRWRNSRRVDTRLPGAAD